MPAFPSVTSTTRTISSCREDATPSRSSRLRVSYRFFPSYPWHPTNQHVEFLSFHNFRGRTLKPERQEKAKEGKGRSCFQNGILFAKRPLLSNTDSIEPRSRLRFYPPLPLPKQFRPLSPAFFPAPFSCLICPGLADFLIKCLCLCSVHGPVLNGYKESRW